MIHTTQLCNSPIPRKKARKKEPNKRQKESFIIQYNISFLDTATLYNNNNISITLSAVLFSCPTLAYEKRPYHQRPTKSPAATSPTDIAHPTNRYLEDKSGKSIWSTGNLEEWRDKGCEAERLENLPQGGRSEARNDAGRRRVG